MTSLQNRLQPLNGNKHPMFYKGKSDRFPFFFVQQNAFREKTNQVLILSPAPASKF